MIKTYQINMHKNKSDILSTSSRNDINNEIIYAICDEPLKKFKNIQFPYARETINNTYYKNIFFILDFNEIVDNKKDVLNKIKKIKLKIDSNQIYAHIQHYKSSNEQDILDILSALKIQFLTSKAQKIDYIYDKTCEYLDNQFTTRNICQFENNKCIAKRDYDLNCGCCRHSKGRNFFSLLDSEFVVCEYLNNKQCTADCISCKLYTCPTLNKMGIKFRIKDLFLIDNYFSLRQKVIIKSYCFTPKEEIIKRLI